MDEKRNRVAYLTFVSVVSAMAVLTLHTNACFWDFSATARYWKAANVIECVFYFAVPLFYMMSSITLLDFFDRYTLREYFGKRVQKTVLPFLVWSMIGLAERILTGAVKLKWVGPWYIYQAIAGSKIISIYWFFPSLFVLYLCLPLFAAVEQEKRKLVYSYLVAAGFLLNQVVPLVKTLFLPELRTPLGVGVVSGYLIYIPLGWLLHHCELKRWQKAIVYALAAAGLLMHILGTWKLSVEAGEIVRTFKGYSNVPSTLYATGVFVLLKDIGRRVMAGKPGKLIKWLGGYTFAIYLMQFLPLKYAPKLPFVNTHTLLYRLGAPYVMACGIIAVTWCLRKIPVVRRIVP